MIVSVTEVTGCHRCKNCKQNGGVYRSLHAKQRGPEPSLGRMEVFFFLVSHPGDEETPCGHPAPCGHTSPWYHPFASQCGQSAPLVLSGYTGVFFLVSHPDDEETPRGQVSAILTPNVASQHPGCLLATAVFHL